MTSNDQATHNLGPSSELPKELKKILKYENCLVRSNGKISCFSIQYPSTSASQFKPRDNVISYDSYYEYRPRCIIRGRMYFPVLRDRSHKIPLILFFHGGGFLMHECTTLQYDDFCRKLALELPCAVISINYPHAPRHKCPGQYVKALEYLKHFDKTRIDSLADTSNVFLSGDEAGGNIAHYLATGIASNEIKLENFKIKGLISIQPLFGGEERTESEILLSKSPMLTLKQRDSMWNTFLPSHYNRDCKEVNVSGPNNTIRNLELYPKTLLIVGGLDPLQDWQKRYCSWLKRCGAEVTLVQYPKGIPRFYLHPNLPESTKLMDDIRLFIYRSAK